MMKKWTVILTLALFVGVLLALPVGAAGEPLPITLSQGQRALTDGRENAAVTVTGELKISSEEEMKALYLIFLELPESITLVRGDEDYAAEEVFLRQFWDLEELFPEEEGDVTLMITGNARIIECYAFGEEIPDWVQRWEAPWDQADLCLFTTHADDEQLFFAGVLPYYAGERDYRVQVIYFTDHVTEPYRRHELLNGLWEVGVRHYPVISPFPDLYSTSLEYAQTQLQGRGFEYDEIVAHQVEMLRRFRPLVVVGHDQNGEYGHGQHRLNSKTLREAVEASANGELYPESAEQYGTWDVPKTYLHLWEENPIEMNWDVPLVAFDGLTAFQVSQRGFAHHTSQQNTWFRRWLVGNAGDIREATQITTHSPCKYGLYRTTVGQDKKKDDFFENLTTWDEKFRQEEERRQAELLKEQERLAAEQAAREKEEAYRLALEEEAARKAAAEERERMITQLITAGAVILLIPVALVLVVAFHKRKRTPSRRRHRR